MQRNFEYNCQTAHNIKPYLNPKYKVIKGGLHQNDSRKNKVKKNTLNCER